MDASWGGWLAAARFRRPSASTCPHYHNIDMRRTHNFYFRRKGKGDKWGDIESLNEPSTAADRYKDKHAKYYSKYGLK